MVQLGNCRSARLLGRKRALQRSRWKCQGSEKRCELHRAAGEGERNEREQSTLEALASEVEQMAEGSGIFLVGMMGSGKSTIASELAYALNYSKLDSDDVIEQVAQKSISQIFSDDGEDAFRQLETSVLQELTAFKRTVLSTGGGTAYHPNNWMHLQNGVVVFLDVHVDRLAERVLADGAADTRPMLESADPGESEEEAVLRRLTELLEERRSWYEQADVHVQLGKDSSLEPQEVAKRVLEQVKQRIASDGTRERIRQGAENMHEPLNL